MAWTQSGNIKGASGVPGASGPPGATGPVGATGASGGTGATGGTGGTGGPGTTKWSDITDKPGAILNYKGTWNASTNSSPTLSDSTGSGGDVYRVSVAGSRNLGSGTISWEVGDYAIYSPVTSSWEKADTTDAVSSVAGRTGAVTITTADLGITGTPSGSTFLRGDGTWASGPTGASGASGASGGTGGTGASGASGASGTPGPTRSISTITANTTLGSTANTDYVTFVSNTAGGAASYVAATGMNNWSYSGSAAQVKNYTHTTGTANYVFVFVHVLVFLGNGTPAASVTFGGTSMTELASRFNAGNECSGFLFGLSGSFSGSYTVGVTLSGHNQGFRATSIASTYNNVNSVGTAVSGSTSITVNSASNVVAFSGSRDGTSGITLTGSTSRLSQQDASGTGDIYSQTIDLLSSSASNRSITSSRAGIVGIAMEGVSPAVPTLPSASGNTNLYTIKNISGSSVTVGVTSNQLIDGASGGLALTNNSTARLISDGSGWRTV